MLKDFYPTPRKLINLMIGKIMGNPQYILEPSAGKGDIIEALRDKNRYSDYVERISAIEINPDLQATLKGKGFNLIDTDFLNFTAPDKFDLIIANPPFDEGDKHLMKAIEIMYSGQIICILNAETLKNPYTNKRRELVKKLSELNAEIEYIKDAFMNGAERKTDVEVALVNIIIERNIETDLFDGVESVEDERPELERNYEVSTGKTIEELVAEYNQTVTIGTEVILKYYKHYDKINKYLGLNDKPASYTNGEKHLTALMQKTLNEMLKDIRINYWRRVLDVEEVHSRLTQKKRDEFETAIRTQSKMDFTESNIRQFIINLIGGFEQTIIDAIVEVFDLVTKYSYGDTPQEENIHYYNGWKTNKAWKCNKKIIIPFYSSDTFRSWGKWKLGYQVAGKTNDIDIVMNYFDGLPHYMSMAHALDVALDKGISSNIGSTYFKMTAFKKGTLHITFKDDDILRRFNVVACKGKGWLPPAYGTKPYQDMGESEKAVVDSFEGEKSYTEKLGQTLIAATARHPLGIANSNLPEKPECSIIGQKKSRAQKTLELILN